MLSEEYRRGIQRTRSRVASTKHLARSLNMTYPKSPAPNQTLCNNVTQRVRIRKHITALIADHEVRVELIRLNWLRVASTYSHPRLRMPPPRRQGRGWRPAGDRYEDVRARGHGAHGSGISYSRGFEGRGRADYWASWEGRDREDAAGRQVRIDGLHYQMNLSLAEPRDLRPR
jgi:hypothetical protein